jgi:hypothetical protein
MAQSVSINTLLNATVSELSDLKKISEDLQEAISLSAPATNGSLQTMQRLDYLTQSLEALSEFWSQTKSSVEDNWEINCGDALQSIPLKDLASALRGDTVLKFEPRIENGVLEEF